MNGAETFLGVNPSRRTRQLTSQAIEGVQYVSRRRLGLASRLFLRPIPAWLTLQRMGISGILSDAADHKKDRVLALPVRLLANPGPVPGLVMLKEMFVYFALRHGGSVSSRFSLYVFSQDHHVLALCSEHRKRQAGQ